MNDGPSMRPERFEHRTEHRGGRFICICGDPNCVYSDRPAPRGGRGPTMGDIMNAMIANRYMAIDSAAPNSLSEARKKVKDYILPESAAVSWDDVIGNEPAKEALRLAIEAPVKHSELYKHYAMRPPKGVLLYGPPGCGKTMFAKASATALGVAYGASASEVIVINASEVQKPYVGETEEIIRNIFAYAREYAAHYKHPLVIFIDECEVLLPDRTAKHRRVAPWEESNVATFLTELDGMKALGAFVILATNRPEALDEALLRDGRCDRKIKVQRPDRAGVYQIVAASTVGAPLSCQADDFAEAVTECFFDPSFVLMDAKLIQGQGAKILSEIGIHFCLEHIVSGAMASSVITRAKNIAFLRDMNAGTISGIQVGDGIAAVRQIFEENKGLEHSFALNEFFQSLPTNEMFEHKGKLQ